jgi:hypothetical protein
MGLSHASVFRSNPYTFLTGADSSMNFRALKEALTHPASAMSSDSNKAMGSLILNFVSFVSRGQI